MTVIHKIMMAYSALGMFNCKQALEMIDTLPQSHLETGLVMGIVILAFKQSRLLNVILSFISIRKQSRFTKRFGILNRIDSTEWISTEHVSGISRKKLN
jgi:hypothetical protein